jgi:hypothetical protein
MFSIKHNNYEFIILWHVDPLLGGDREMGDCTATYAR